MHKIRKAQGPTLHPILPPRANAVNLLLIPPPRLPKLLPQIWGHAISVSAMDKAVAIYSKLSAFSKDMSTPAVGHLDTLIFDDYLGD